MTLSNRPMCSFFLLLSLFATLSLGAEDTAKVDADGDALPPQALARLGTARFRHGHSIQCLAYSPDGKLLAAGGYGMISLWDAQDGRRIRVVECSMEGPQVLAFSPDSKHLVSAHNSYVDGKEQRSNLRVWNVGTGKPVGEPLDLAGHAYALAFSSDGKTSASADPSHSIHLWEWQTGRIKHVLSSENPDKQVCQFAFAADGTMLAITGKTIRTWNLQTEKVTERKIKDVGEFQAVAFSSDGSTLAVACVGGIRVYRVSNLREITWFPLKDEPVQKMAFSANGAILVSNAQDKTVRIWDMGSEKQCCQLPKQNEGSATFGISPDSTTVATGEKGGVIQVWNAKNGKCRDSHQGHLDVVNRVAFLSEGKTVAVRWNSYPHVTTWLNGTGKEMRPMTLPPETTSAEFCLDRSSLAVATPDGELCLLEVASGRERKRCAIRKNLTVHAVSTDYTRAVVNPGGWLNLEVWNLTTRKPVHRFEPNVEFSGFSRDGRMVAVLSHQKYETTKVCVWDLDSKKELCRIPVSDEYLCSLAFSPDGRTVALGCYNPTNHSSMQLFEVATGKLRTHLGSTGWVRGMAFSTEGNILVSGGDDKMVRLWDVRNGQELHVFAGHAGIVLDVAFSPNNRRVVSGSMDTTALVWDIPTDFFRSTPKVVQVDPQAQTKLWRDLGDQEASTAYNAQQQLAATPAVAVSLCQKHLFETATTPEQIQQWIAQLDDDEYTVREQASRKLECLEREAEKVLQQDLKGDCSPETRRRIESLLELLGGRPLQIRPLRAVELMEQIGSPEAINVLRQLERKTGDSVIRDDVRRSLRRLEAKRTAP